MSEIIKAIKQSKEVFLEIASNDSYLYVKVVKKDFLNQLQSRKDCLNRPFIVDDEFEIVTQYGKSSLYLSRKIN